MLSIPLFYLSITIGDDNNRDCDDLEMGRKRSRQRSAYNVAPEGIQKSNDTSSVNCSMQ